MRKATLSQLLQVGNMVESGALDRETVQAIIEGRIQIVEPALSWGFETSYILTLDRTITMTLGDLIVAGKYDSVNKDITPDRFPLAPSSARLERTNGETGKEEIEVVLVYLDKRLTINQVKNEFDRRGLKSALIDILLAFGAAKPELQREFPIMALGSVWRSPDGGLHSPCLGRNVHGRNLNLHLYHPGQEWSEGWRFLAVRKVG